ncbi:MAG: helix-turn-helix domain-containing protein [Actinomycetota bacterium]|nr:helix-turn-helix domain-containing protein [Actinomycetota bacterium]
MENPDFGPRLKELRQTRGLSQAELGGDALSPSYVSLLESGRRQPTRKIAAALAARLGVDVEYLLTGTEQPAREQRELDLRFAELALRSGDAAAAQASYERLRASPGLDPGDLWRIDYGLARTHETLGQLEEALRLLEGLRERALTDPARWPWLVVVMDLSRCYREVGDLARAVDVAEEAVERTLSMGLANHVDFPRLVVTLAGASRERGDLTRAAQLLTQLLTSMSESTPRRDRGAALWNAALVAAERGHFADGILLAERALAQFADEEQTRAKASVRTLLAWILLEAPGGDIDRALTLLAESHAALLEAGMQIELAYTETELARVEVASGHPDEAITWARSALNRLGDSDRLESSRARLALARALLLRGETTAAVTESQAAAEALRGISASRQAAAVWRDLAEVEGAAGHVEAAQAAYRTALDVLGVFGQAPTVAFAASRAAGVTA